MQYSYQKKEARGYRLTLPCFRGENRSEEKAARRMNCFVSAMEREIIAYASSLYETTPSSFYRCDGEVAVGEQEVCITFRMFHRSPPTPGAKRTWEQHWRDGVIWEQKII